MALRNGPFTDENGRTYYEVTADDGTTTREYVATASPSATTTVSPDGSVVQPQNITTLHNDTLPTSPQSLNTNQTDPLSDLSYLSDQGGKTAQPSQNYTPYYSDGVSDLRGGMSDLSRGGAPGVPAASSYYQPQAAPASTGGPPLAELGNTIRNAVVDQGGQRDQGYQQQVTVPSTGATAGPFGVQPARSDSGGSYGVSSGPDLPNSGGGGGRSALYDKLSAKGDAMAGRVRGMAEGAGGGPDPQAQYKAQQQRYRQEGRRITQAQRKWERMQADPNYLPVKGVLDELGYNKEMAAAYLDDPTPVLESVLGRSLGTNNYRDQQSRKIAWNDLALLSAGTGRKGPLTSKTPVDRMPHILKKQGWDQPKPESKRVLDPSKVANEVRDIYQQFITTGQKPSGQELLGNLATIRRHSALGTQLATTAKYDPGAAVDSIRSLITSAVMDTRRNHLYDDTLNRALDTKLGGYTDELAGHKAKKITKGVRNVANDLLAGGIV